MADESGSGFREFLEGWGVEGVGVVEVPILFGGDEGQMGARHSDGEEEGLPLLFEFGEGLDGKLSDLAVFVGVVGDVGGFGCGSAGSAFCVLVGGVGHGLECLRGGVLRGLGFLPWCGPTGGIIEAAVEDLAHALSEVAVVFEVLRDRDGVGERFAEMSFQIPDASGVGSASGQKRGAGRAANSLLTVGAIEGGSAGCDAVEVGGLEEVGAGGGPLGS